MCIEGGMKDMNYQNPMIVGEIDGNSKIQKGIPFHLMYENGKLVARSFFSDAVVKDVCFNTDKKLLQKLAEEKADLKMIRQKDNAVAFAFSNLKKGIEPAVTAWNA